LLATTVRQAVADSLPLDRVLAAARSGEPVDDSELWRRLSAIGIPGLLVPTRFGGSNASLTEHVIALIECGRGLVPDAVTAHAMACRALVAAGAPAEPWLAELAGGRRAAFVHGAVEAGGMLSGVVPLVPEAGQADLLVVSVHNGPIVVVDVAGVRRDHVSCLDTTRRWYDVRFDSTPMRVVAEDRAAESIRRGCVELARLSVAADATGGALGALRLAVEYARVRTQFGRPIGSFQAIKHLLADVYVGTELAQSLATHAARVIDGDLDHRDLAIAAAKAVATEGYLKAAAAAVQVHGGMGFTQDVPAYLFLQRARVNERAGGSAREHYRDIGDRIAAGASLGW
jgi:alkylation response protein AidB-like acyl-CoA dehydrogenase